MIYSDTVFWAISGAIVLMEALGFSIFCEKKMKQMDERERKAEQRRKERSRDDYCTREVERLYYARRR